MLTPPAAAARCAARCLGRDFTIAQTSLMMSGDLHEHLGQLIAYARSNGVKPPWSR